MARRKKKTKPTWSITRIKHPKYPQFSVRVGEFQAGGMLHFFRKVNGKQTSRSLKCRRSDLGSTLKAQETEAKRLAIEYIEALAHPCAVDALSDGTSTNPFRKSASKQLLTIAALADQYELDGLVRVTAGYKRDTLAAIRRIGSFLEPSLLVRDIKPSHLEKYLASRAALHHAVAWRGAIVALSICCNWAVGEGLLDTNPLATKPARKAMSIQHTVHQPWVRDEEFEKLKAVASQLPPAFAVLLELANGTGRRISAILGLRWADVLVKPEEALAKCKELDPRCDWLVRQWRTVIQTSRSFWATFGSSRNHGRGSVGGGFRPALGHWGGRGRPLVEERPQRLLSYVVLVYSAEF